MVDSLAWRGVRLVVGIIFSFMWISTCVMLTFLHLLNPIFHKFMIHSPTEIILVWWCTSVLKFLGVDVVCESEVTHEEAKKTSIMMYSHGSNLDPMIIGATCPVPLYYVAKIPLFRTPLIGWWGFLTGHIPINRAKLSHAIMSLEEAGDKIVRDSKSVSIAPEGTRRRSPSLGSEHLLPFKKGAFHMALKVKAPIIPCVIHGANELWGPGTKFSNYGTVYARYLKPIQPEEYAHLPLEEVQKLVRDRMIDTYKDLPARTEIRKERMPGTLFYGIFFSCIFLAYDWWNNWALSTTYLGPSY
mmetsp:Transcript_59987/g.68223  ORF Transcript_59987/g.68223 Transcript_59987/m.68223 type:complete len:300 (+) Transcript_59987:69-968(+)